MVFAKGHKPRNTFSLKGKKSRYNKVMSDLLADSWKRPELVVLYERIAILSTNEADLKRIEQCVDSIETVNQWNKEDFPEEAN